MADQKQFEGSSGRQPSSTNTPDSLFSEDIVEFVLAVSEGPIRGLTEGAKSFYVGGTPLVAQDGTNNFSKFAVGVYPGYAEGSSPAISMMLGGQASTQNVAVTLLKNVAVTRQTQPIHRATLDASGNMVGGIDSLGVRINFARLLMSNDSGTHKADAQFKLEYKKTTDSVWNNFYATPTITINGKTSNGYAKVFRVDVPKVTNADWQVRVTKLSNDAYVPPIDPNTGNPSEAPPPGDTIYCDMVWDDLDSISKEPAIYPNTAVIHGVGVANGQFSSIPEFSGVYDGMIIRVPTNYNPDLRTYDESTPWNGSFKFAWTNNPAWILYDLIVNPVYGMAAYRVYTDADRYDFYLAAKWCDELVPSGVAGEMQPRYTFNSVIKEQRPVMELLNYVAGSFNALVWDDLNGKIHLKVDKDDPAVIMFTPENVTETGFNYTFTDITTRANDITVAFINPDLDWNEDHRRIPNVTTNEAAIAEFGRIPFDFIAVGCTNAQEAVRKAKVRLTSALTETTMCTFTTTREGALVSLFDVILIADPLMGWSQSGRITTIDSSWVNFRDAIYIETMQNYVLKIQTAGGVQQITVKPEAIGLVTKLQVLSTLPANIPRHAVFTLEQSGAGFGLAKPFRVTSIEEVDGSPYLFKITCIEINRTKYFDSEYNTQIDEIEYGFKQPSLPGGPTNFKAISDDTQLLVNSDGSITNRIYCSWRKALGSVVTQYELQWRLITDTEWSSVVCLEESGYCTPVLKGGHYALRVRAADPSGFKSGWTNIADHVVIGKVTIPRALSSFTSVGDLYQNILSWTFPGAKDVSLVEIKAATTNNFNAASVVAEISYPTNRWVHVGLGVGVTVYYWARIKDTSGNYSAYSTTSSTSTADPGKVLEVLQGSIRKEQLFSDLQGRIDLIDAPVTGLVTKAADLRTDLTLRVDSDGALASAINTLWAKVGNTTALVSNGQKVTINNTGSEVAKFDQLQSVVLNPTTGLVDKYAALRQEYDVSVTDIGGLKGQYSVKLDLNGYVAGFGLSSTSNLATGTTSAFVVLADKFAVATPGKTPKIPFVVGNVNGVSTVGIDGNVFIDGSMVIRDANGQVIFAAGVPLDYVQYIKNKPTSLSQISTTDANALNNAAFQANAAVTDASYALNQAGEAASTAGTALSTANTAKSTADTAATDAANALSSANTASNAIMNITSDNVLSMAEKPAIILQYDTIISEQNNIVSVAVSLGVGVNAYNVAVTALTDYLNSLGPSNAWRNLNIDTAINGGVMRSKFQNVFTSRQDVMNNSASAAAARADWTYVTGNGKPENNATKGATIGVDLSGQMNSSTIFNYIGNAAVTTMLLGDEVVMIPRFISTNVSNEGYGMGAGATTLITHTFFLPYPGRVMATFTGHQTYGFGERNSRFQMSIYAPGGTEYIPVAFAGVDVSTTPTFAGATPGVIPAGLVTVTVFWWGQDSGINCDAQRLTIMGVMR